MLITVFTKSNCIQCTMTKKEMDKRGIAYEELNIEEHPETLQAFIDAGLTAAPIVVTDIKRWSGFRLNKIESLHNYLRSQNK
jgi:glutaredoxin-like protein NrdH